MNRKQKQALAALVIRGIADALNGYEDDPTSYPEYAELRAVTGEELYEQAAVWAKALPGASWDSRLPL